MNDPALSHSARDAGSALYSEAVWTLERDEEHADLCVLRNVAHRQEHAVAVVTRKHQCRAVDNLDEA